MDSQTKDKENLQEISSPSSPYFLKPKPLNIKKKSIRNFNLPLKEINTNTQKEENIVLSKSPIKPLNPFRCLVNKRKREVEIENDDDSSNSVLWQWTNNKVTRHSKELKTAPSPIVPAILDENALFGFTNQNKNSSCVSTEITPEKPKHKHIPIDWSLKTKVRFTSSKPFPWRTSFKTSEEASGTTGFIRCLHADQKNKKQCSLDSSYGAKFFQQCLVWQHPYLPWLDLFPRSDKIHKNNMISAALDIPLQESLHAKWCDSFRSLYQLVRTRQCPFFYLCAPTFTVLFRSNGVASILDLHAIITPTTKGLRKALTDDGVIFTMPLCTSKDADLSTDSLLDDNTQFGTENDETCSLDEQDETCLDDDEPEIWLESLGLSQDDFPSLNKRKIKNKVQIDHKPESLVYVEGSETQSLVNFLLNFPSCTSRIGPMAGIPPTLLSPVGFLGSTLQRLKIRHGKVQKDASQIDTVELSGPLLPNTIHSLCSLLNETQDGTFSASLTAHAPTLAFSKFVTNSSTVPSVFATENLRDSGLSNSFIKQMCSKNDCDSILNLIQAEAGMFTWS